MKEELFDEEDIMGPEDDDFDEYEYEDDPLFPENETTAILADGGGDMSQY